MPKFSNELKEVAIQAAHGATTTQFSNKDLSDAVRKNDRGIRFRYFRLFYLSPPQT